jgi:hypothetical protein
MKLRFVTPVLFFVVIFSCKSPDKKTDKQSVSKAGNTNKSDTSLKKIVIPVFGYRFVITGDFDGDGKKETLVEHYFSGIDNKETNKFYEGIDYDELVDRTIKNKPYSFVSCDNKLIDTLKISSSPQLFGLSYLKNEGDLDGDGADEVSYVVDGADWSNMNSWHIMTFKNKKWKELYLFAIWDWQLPDLPETFNQRGPFGMEDKIINTENVAANKKIKQNLDNFEGLVKKISNNKIRIIYQTSEAELDTTIVDLRKKKKLK